MKKQMILVLIFIIMQRMILLAGDIREIEAKKKYFGNSSDWIVDELPPNVIDPRQLEYKGAFNVPRDCDISNWCYDLAYYSDGDSNGEADGYPGSLFITKHVSIGGVAEITIPIPKIVDLKTNLPYAKKIQVSTKKIVTSNFDGDITGLCYLPKQGVQTSDKLYLLGRDATGYGRFLFNLGWCDINFSSPNPVGAWKIKGQNSIWRAADAMMEIPKDWADKYCQGQYLAYGGAMYCTGGKGLGCGPDLFVAAPWESGNPPAPQTEIPVKVLLRYEGSDRAINDRRLYDGWHGGAFLTSGDKSALIFTGVKDTGEAWYGVRKTKQGLRVYASVPQKGICGLSEMGDQTNDTGRGYISDTSRSCIYFYNPADLADVAQGKKKPWEPQPYARMDVLKYMYKICLPDNLTMQQKYDIIGCVLTINGCAYDRKNNLIYYIDASQFNSSSIAIIHVWKLHDNPVTDWKPKKIESGSQIKLFTDKEAGDIYSVVFSSDEKYILTGTLGGVWGQENIALWDITSGKQLRKEKGVSVAMFSPDNKYIAATGRLGDYGSASIKLYDITTNNVKEFKNGETIFGWTFSPDGKQLIIGTRDGKIIIINVPNLSKVKEWKINEELKAVRSIVFSSDGSKILTSSNDTTVAIWDLNGNKIKEFKGHTNEVHSAVFSPDEKYVLTASDDTTAILWDVSSGNKLKEFKHLDEVRSARFSPNGQYVVTASDDTTAVVWEVVSGNKIKEFKGHTDIVWNACFSPDGKTVLTVSQDWTAMLWDVVKGNKINEFIGHQGTIWHGSFSKDGKYVLTGSKDNTARLWSTSIESISSDKMIKNFMLQNYPNPFNPECYIPYELKESGNVKVRIYNVLGQKVRELNLGQKQAGKYVTKDKAVYWDGKDSKAKEVVSGVYYYELIVNSKIIGIRKSMVLK